jgi:hypothetical protein
MQWYLTGENGSIRWKTCSSATMFNINRTSTGLESKLRLQSEWQGSNSLRHGTASGISESIPSGVTGIFSDIFPSDRTIDLGSTQPLVKMSTRNIPGDKGGRCVRLTTLPPSCAKCHEILEPKPPGTLRVTPGLLRDSLHGYPQSG